MDKKAIEEELNSEGYKEEWERLVKMRTSLIQCLLFCLYNSSRDGISAERNFLLRMIDDITQSVMSIELLAKEGITNTSRRELRYLIEVGIKSCFIVQDGSMESLEDQIKKYTKLLSSANINPINTLSFYYFQPAMQDEFKTEVKRLYGYLSNYTHATSTQTLERIARAEAGKTIGYEGINELRELNDEIQRVFAAILVFVFHSVAQHVVGDFLVEPSGKSTNWYFSRSRFISAIDQRFDYKAERQDDLEEIKQTRSANISF